jgi:hypothetical protein
MRSTGAVLPQVQGAVQEVLLPVVALVVVMMVVLWHGLAPGLVADVHQVERWCWYLLLAVAAAAAAAVGHAWLLHLPACHRAQVGFVAAPTAALLVTGS